MESEFTEVKGPGGRRMLVNLALVVAFTEEADGNTGAVTLAGATIKLGEKFSDFAADMAVDGDGESKD